jgi:hypothetical protein
VYHPYAIFFGNYSSLTLPPYDDLWPAESTPKEPLKLLDRRFSRQFFLEQARAFIWGQQPTIANFTREQLAQRRKEIDYALQLARVRHLAAEYLLRGEMLRPPEIQVGDQTIPMSRLSIYAGQKEGIKTFDKQVPRALGSAWRAPSGKVAVLVASIAEETLTIQLGLPLGDYALPEKCRAVRIEGKTRKQLPQISGGYSSIQLKLPPLKACVIELSGEAR